MVGTRQVGDLPDDVKPLPVRESEGDCQGIVPAPSQREEGRMKALRTLWAEFRAFAFKGNMIDLAVAVIIGAAFSGVIDSLVKDVIMPTLSYATSAVKEAKERASQAADTAGQHMGVTSPPTTGPATQPTTGPTTQPAAAVAGGPGAAAPATRPADVAGQAIAAAAVDHPSREWQDMASAFAAALAADRKAAEAKAEVEKAEAA